MFKLAKFRALFPAFDAVPDATVEAVAEQAACYISSACRGACADQLLMLMVAHLLQLRSAVAAGGGMAISSASEGGVSVSMAQPASADARSQWLAITPYGQQYAALEAKCAKGKAAAGLFLGGYPEGDAFRRVYGVFPRRKL